MAGMENKKKKRKGLKIAAAVFALLMCVLITLGIIFEDSKNIDYEEFRFTRSGGGGGFKIIHLSDMHFPKIKVDLNKLLERIEAEKPDIIAVTGDLIDGAGVEGSGVFDFIDKLKASPAPVFYVSGNHEKRSPESQKLFDYISFAGVTILNNRSVNLAVRGKEITVIGLTDDTAYDPLYLADNPEALGNYKILLAHRPERWPGYISESHSVRPDLILCGHTHGGQIRPGRALFAPGQGFFPKYDSGLYQTEDSSVSMIISRGIGTGKIPFRINSKPHVPVITVSL